MKTEEFGIQINKKMNKRSFIRNTFISSAGFTLLPDLFTSIVFPKNKSKNWIWAHPNTNWTADDWKRQLSKAKDAGIDALLLEIYNGTHTYFEGGQLPMKANVTEIVLPICKSLGLEFHAWMWTMPCNAQEIITAHPDWFAHNGLGQPAHTHPAYVPYYKFLCPCHPEVRDFIKGNVTSLAKISEIDGIHLDYVRLPDVILAEGLQPKYNIIQDKEYPQYDYSYSPHCRDGFKAKTGIDPLIDLKEPSSHQEWMQFRRDSVTLVNDALVPEAKKYNKQITAAVFPNWESVRQEWHRWHLDGFLPMLYHNFYNRDIDFITEHTQKAVARLKGKIPVYSGLFVPSITPENLKNAIKSGISGGSSGTSFFDLGAMNDEHWEILLKK
jgi:uncharacterized lipoprotein YddW (UPF0748 family)